jgi:uncharacterized protein YjbK
LVSFELKKAHEELTISFFDSHFAMTRYSSASICKMEMKQRVTAVAVGMQGHALYDQAISESVESKRVKFCH